jgi:opacity protein-like surface antigen
MQRLLGLSFLLIMFAIPAIAQDVPASPPQATPPPATQEAPPPAPVIPSKTEISGGFTLNRYNETNGTTTTMPGGYGDVEHNIIQRWLGVELQGVGGFRDQGVLGDLSIYTIMAGPTFYPFGHRKITFFGHILAGEGYYRDSIPPSTGFPALVTTHTSFAWAGGAGLDLAVSKRLAVRLAQFDYTETKFFGGTVHENNTRISIGIVYHFGR